MNSDIIEKIRNTDFLRRVFSFKSDDEKKFFNEKHVLWLNNKLLFFDKNIDQNVR